MGIRFKDITTLATGLLASHKIAYDTGTLTRLLRFDTLADWIVQTYASFTQSGIGALISTVQTALRLFVHTSQYSTVGNYETARNALSGTAGIAGVDIGGNTTNALVGYRALLSNTTGTSNTAFGAQALISNTDGAGNTAVGRDALLLNVSGDSNTACGRLALTDNTGDENSAFGSEALADNTTGTNNTAVGRGALKANVGGEENVAVGIGALGIHTTGDLNVACGGDALSLITSGSYNTGIGTDALRSLVTGSNNVGVGDDAGRYTGALAAATAFESCVYVGQIAKVSAATGVSNENVFGFSATGFGTNSVTLGNGSITDVVPGGDNHADLGDTTRRFRTLYLSAGARSSGGFGKFTSTGGYSGESSAFHEIRSGEGGQPTLYLSNTHASTPTGAFFYFEGAAPDNNTQYFLTCQDTGAVRCIIYSDGDLQNHDNSYAGISDERLKQDIVDSGSQWEDIKNLRVRKYRFKSDVEAGKDHQQLGLIAQEVQPISPGLVTHNPERDEYGVQYSVLYMKAVKCLQEAMERIEKLETQVANLPR